MEIDFENVIDRVVCDKNGKTYDKTEHIVVINKIKIQDIVKKCRKWS